MELTESQSCKKDVSTMTDNASLLSETEADSSKIHEISGNIHVDTGILS